MNLLLDIGNTRIKWALHDGVKPLAFGHSRHQDYSAVLEQVPGDSLWGIYYACVASEEFEQEFVGYLERYGNAVITKLQTSDACCGVSNGYLRPGQLGVDRWAALIAARQLFDAPACVVDCGSAVTVDALDRSGRHLGGYIVPGLSMQQQLLRHGTAAVDVDELVVGHSGWGNTTHRCVSQGSAEAIAGLIERSYRQLTQQCGEAVVTVVTGGDAVGILPLLTHQAHHEEHLVLLGMAYMAKALEG